MLLAFLVAGCSGGGSPPVSTTPPGAPPPLRVMTSSLPPGEVGQSYQASLSASGGQSPYRWSIATGALPAGVALDAAGVVSGTPTAAGDFNVTFRVQDSSATPREASATFSLNIQTPPPPPPPPPLGMWLSQSEIQALPTNGTAWQNLKQEAESNCGSVKLSNQDDETNVCILAKALVYARTGDTRYRDPVIAAIQSIADSGTYNGRALALGRELAAYVIAADLIDLKLANDELDQRFRLKLRELLTTHTKDGPDNLQFCQEERPNNWGTMCGASRAAVAIYLDDRAELERTAQVFRGYLGDRTSYAGFKFKTEDQRSDSWSPLPADLLIAINPKGAVVQGHNVDGAPIDDISRGGPFEWPPLQTQYPWEGLGGAIVQAELLCRAGYPDVYDLQDQALRRAYEYLLYLHQQFGFWFDAGTIDGDDNWQPWIANLRYGIQLPTRTPTRAGKQMGWSDWTHGAVSTVPVPCRPTAPATPGS